MNKIIFILFVFIVGCSLNDSMEFDKVTLNYLHNSTIDDSAWIEIDGTRFVHVNSLKQVNARTMPVTNVIVDQLGDKQWKTEINYIGMGIHLARAIESLSNDQVTYIVEKDFNLNMLGKVKITRSDGKPISISYSENYPVSVTGENN